MMLWRITSQSAGVYPGFDRFGRVARQSWADGALTTHSTDSTISSRPPIVEETHSYDRASNRKSKTDARKGASWSNRDFAYDYDGLHRLLTAKRGAAGTSFTRGPGWQDWSLDMLGNWNSVGTDTNGDGDTSDSGESDTRTHNMANELSQRAMTGVLGTPFDFTYDDSGNAREIETGLNTKRRYTHDAWNRLVKIENGAVSGGSTTWTTIGAYQYNGLHWRVVADSDRATPTGLDRRTYMYYSAGWQLLQEDIDDHSNGGSPDGVDSRSQEVWGLRYIDDAMVRLLDKNLDGDCRDSGELFWQLSDAQFSSVAVVEKNAVLQERVSYTSYGVGTHRWPHEVNNTGGVTTSGSTSDYGVIDGLAAANSGAGTTINETTYNVAADLNRDGVIDSTDTSIFTSTFGGAKSALAGGLISDPNGPDNVFGYDGYVYNPDQGLYTVRFRWYNPTFGRWLERDPAGYVDGMSLSEYSRNSPSTHRDPLGLDAGWAKRGRFDPYGFGMCIPRFDIDWDGKWSPAEQSQVLAAMTLANERAKRLALEIDAIRATLSACELALLGAELDEMQKRMNDVSVFIENARKEHEMEQEVMDEGKEAITSRGGGVWSSCTTLELAQGIDNWLLKTTPELAALLLHELSHVVEGKKDHDATGVLCDLNYVNTPKGKGYFDTGIRNSGCFKFKLMEAKRKCSECHEPTN